MSDDQAASKKRKKFVPPQPAELDPLFPSYNVTDFIAAGGMGAVYRAEQISLERAVAIKILPKEFGQDKQFRESFEAEAKAMARLNHPNLMSVYDFGEVEGMLFIAMEFVQGKALYYSAHRKQIDPVIAFKLIAAVSRGVAHAHDNNILHRDLKPANILLLPDTTPKVGDFGLARSVNSGQRERTTYGTPGYTAPEVYSKKFPIDQRSDIFSLGAMLAELLSGELPKPNSSHMITGLDPRFDAITRKATHPIPHQRHSSTHEFIAELEALIPELEGTASPRRNVLLNTGQITTRVAAHVTGPISVATGPVSVATGPVGMATGPISMATGPLTAAIPTGSMSAAMQQTGMQGYPAPPAKKKGGAGAILAGLLGVGAVGAIVFLVLQRQQENQPTDPTDTLADSSADSSASQKPLRRTKVDDSAPAPRAQIVFDLNTAEGRLAKKTVDEIRAKVRKKHSLRYDRYDRRQNRILDNFYEDSGRLVSEGGLPTDQANSLMKVIQDAERNRVLPESFPPDTPGPINSLLKRAHRSDRQNKTNFSGNLEHVRSDYLGELATASQNLRNQGNPRAANFLTREAELAMDEDEMIYNLLANR